jgi:hypothetical protein
LADTLSDVLAEWGLDHLLRNRPVLGAEIRTADRATATPVPPAAEQSLARRRDGGADPLARKAALLDLGTLFPVRDGLSAGGKWILTIGSRRERNESGSGIRTVTEATKVRLEAAAYLAGTESVPLHR